MGYGGTIRACHGRNFLVESKISLGKALAACIGIPSGRQKKAYGGQTWLIYLASQGYSTIRNLIFRFVTISSNRYFTLFLLGHCWPGAIPHNNDSILSRCNGLHFNVWRHKRGVLQQCSRLVSHAWVYSKCLCRWMLYSLETDSNNLRSHRLLKNQTDQSGVK